MNNNSKKIKSFTDLNAWKEAHSLVLMIYKITKDFPKEEMFGLTSQIRRAVISITSNIAEGFSRQTYKEKIQFYFIAKSSLTEVQNQLLIARDINYINKQNFNDIANQSIIVHKLLNGLIKKSKDIQNSKFKIQNSSGGFTLIEMLLVIAIISVISSMTLLSYKNFKNNKALSFGLKQFTADIRVAQNNAFSVLQHNGNIPDGGYGIMISTANNNSYILFADNDGDHIFDGGMEIVETVSLPSEVTINSVITTPADVGFGTVDIVFTSPYGEVFVNTESTSTGSEVIKVEIEICNSLLSCETFIVNSEGLVSE